MYDLERKFAVGVNAINQRNRFDPEHRRKHMNASEAGTCIRRQWYEKHDPESGEEQSWGFANRGATAETFIIDALKAANVDLRLAGEEQESVSLGLISGTPDGVIVDHDMEVLHVVEFKSIDPRVRKSDLPRAPHVTQLKLNMCLIDEHAVALGLPDWRMGGGVVLYLDASNFDDVVTKTVPYDPAFIESMEPRAKKILRSRSVNTIPREGKSAGGKECGYCPFKAICITGDDVAEGSMVRASPRGTRLDASVRSYVEQKGVKTAAEKAMKEDAERIKAELKSRGVNSLDVGDHHVELTKVAGRKTLDKKALVADGVDIEPYEKIGAPSERLTIT